jgi:hypothetical protein
VIAPSRISPSLLFVLPAFLLGATLERGANSAQSPCPVGAVAEVHYGPGEDLALRRQDPLRTRGD